MKDFLRKMWNFRISNPLFKFVQSSKSHLPKIDDMMFK